MFSQLFTRNGFWSFPVVAWAAAVTAFGLSSICTAVFAQSNLPSPLPPGTYFYGESPQPGMLGQEYFIFQIQGQQLKGAFFAYQSEFACTTGTVAPAVWI